MPRVDPWFPIVPAAGTPRVRLICLPHAGGGASMFRGWTTQLPGDVAVMAVQLPGRENRIAEPAFASMKPLVAALADAIHATVADDAIPYAFFGYSMGALIAFELAREVRRRGLSPAQRLILAAHQAPRLPRRKAQIHTLPDGDFAREIVTWNGIPSAVAADKEALEFFLPLLRADITLCEQYQYGPDGPLDSPLVVYGGTDDPDVSPAELEGWREETTRDCVVRLFAGDHFFARTRRDDLLADIASALAAE